MKRSPLLGFLVIVVASAGVGWALSHGPSTGGRVPISAGPAARPSARPWPGWSYLAVARGGRLSIYRGPGSRHLMAQLGNPTATRMPLTLLVRRTLGPWIEAFLPSRPNGSLGWVRRQAVRLVTTPWSLTVRLREHRLLVLRAGRLLRVYPIAVGKASTPTPVGTYFITELLQQPDPTGPYGPYAYGTSAHSTVIKHFGSSGDGEIGLHGTDQPWVLGSSVTHGCIRVNNADVFWLAERLPLGTPLRIERS